MNKQKLIIIALIIVILGCITISIFMIKNNQKEEEENNNFNNITNKEVLKDKEIDGLKITNELITTGKNITTFKAIVTNDTDKNIKFEKLYVIFTKEENQLEVIALSNITLEPKENQYINLSIDQDLTDITQIDYRIE